MAVPLPRAALSHLLQLLQGDLWSAMVQVVSMNRTVRGWTEIIMRGARSSAYVGETFYEHLRAAALPDPLRLSVNNSLSVLLEDDGDGVVPDDRSFATLLKFLSDRPRWIAPGLTVDRQGAFVAIWEVPGVFRWSLTFLPVGEIEWTALEKSPNGELVRHTGRGRTDSIELPHQQRQSILAY